MPHHWDLSKFTLFDGESPKNDLIDKRGRFMLTLCQGCDASTGDLGILPYARFVSLKKNPN